MTINKNLASGTLNKFSKTTGLLNPACGRSYYEAIAAAILEENSKTSLPSAVVKFRESLESAGLRGTVATFAEYFNAQYRVKQAIPPASASIAAKK